VKWVTWEPQKVKARPASRALDVRVTRARWFSLLATTLCATVVHGNSTAGGVVSFAEGDPFTIVRRDTLMSGAQGVALTAGDFLETGPTAFFVVQGPDGSLIGVGPSTAIYLVERAEIATLFVIRGWVKADVKAAPMRIIASRLGIQGHQAVMVLCADERSSAVFDEQGSTTIVLPDTTPMPLSTESGSNHFFQRDDRSDVVSQPSPSAEFVDKMPLAFRDSLPAYAKLPEPVPPRGLRAVTYPDVEALLTIPSKWRGGFIGRFRGRLKDPAFFKAMDAHLALFPEWTPILHPPPDSESDVSPDKSLTRSTSKQHNSESQQRDAPP